MVFLTSLILLTFFTPVNSKNLDLIQDLETALYKGFDEVWPFLERFSSPSELRVDKVDLYKGLVNLGPWTEFAMNRIIEKVLNRETIRMLIIGESISAGANLGCRNNKRTFHHGLASWWEKTITAATGSRLIRHQIAVGGVATNYFDRCWKEYLYANETFDLVLWEFTFNDADAVDQCKSLERFTRSLADLDNAAGLIYVSFFRKTFFDQYTSRTSKNPCETVSEEAERRHEEHEKTIAKTANYYGVTLCDLEQAICSAMENKNSSLKVKYMFNTDHPSFLAHAQMTFILIHYLRGSFARIVSQMKLPFSSTIEMKANKKSSLFVASTEKPKVESSLPSPIYLTQDEADMASEPICWTAVQPNNRQKPKHDLFDLRVKHTKSFKKLGKMDWKDTDERRFDSTGGYQTTKTNQTIRFDFVVPPRPGRTHRRISIAIRNKFFGGKIEVILRSYVRRSANSRSEPIDVDNDVIDSSTNTFSGLNVFDLSNEVGPGRKSLVVKTVTGGVMICGIIIN